MPTGNATALLLAVLISTPFAAQAETEKWLINTAYSAVHFEIKHLLIASLRGAFHRVEGEAHLDEDDVSRSRVWADIDVGSLYTGDRERDAFALGPDFLEQSKFPRISFRSTKVERAPGGHLLVHGLLTVRGISRQVSLVLEGPTAAVRDQDNRRVRALVARTTIDRKHFGMTWQQGLPGGGLALGDEIRLEIAVELVQPHGPHLAGSTTGTRNMAMR